MQNMRTAVSLLILVQGMVVSRKMHVAGRESGANGGEGVKSENKGRAPDTHSYSLIFQQPLIVSIRSRSQIVHFLIPQKFYYSLINIKLRFFSRKLIPSY